MKDFAEYNKGNVYFAYPYNWTIQESEPDDKIRMISVDSPEGSFWSLVIYPKETDPDLAAKEVLRLMNEEYKDCESSEAHRIIGERFLTGYEINFFYLDLTSTALVLGFEEGDQTYVVYWQTCDRMALTNEKLSQEDVFEAITYTFLNNLKKH